MKEWLLIILITGQPEREVATTVTYKQCSDTGSAMQKDYVRQFQKMPHDFGFRCERITRL